MANNSTADPGAGGDVFATDDVAGVHHPRVKLVDGTEDSTTVVAAGGGVEANALRVTVASDSTGVLSVDDNGGSLTVDNAALSVTGGGVEASALRVTIASDSTGVVSVDDNGGSLTVDGTVGVSGTVTVDSELTTADLDTGAGTDTRAVVGLVGSASGGGALIPGDATNGLDVDVTRVQGTVTIAGAVTNAGTFATQVDGAALTALQKIDDPVLVDDAAFTPATSSVMAAGFFADQTATDSVNEGDIGAARMTLDRKVIVTTAPSGDTEGVDTFHLVSAASTNATNIKASAGKVYGWMIYNSNAAARKVAFHNSAGTPTAGASVHSSLVIPPTSAANVEFTNGIAFSTGIAITTVTGLADSDATAVAANDLIMNIYYK